MRILHESTCLGDLGSRLRFLTARQIEMALSGMFPYVRALPFGSSVNGFGRAGCDLDLVLQLGGQEEGLVDEQKSRSRLMFHSKGSAACNGRVQLQRHMETIADMLHLFLPGCSRVVRILQARVPIIKFRHDLAMLECDLSMTNMTAVHMSELLYILGETDQRVRPLVFCVRRWAQAVGLTNPTPGRWVTNFSLSLLTLFYLQTCSKPVIPSLGTLIQLAGEKDRRITAEGVNCTFLRELSNLALSGNQESLEELFRGFFEFYSQFDFASRGISLVTGKNLLKPDHSPLFIENPLERSLNVSKNVSAEETLRLQIELRNAAWFLEQQEEEEPHKGPNWGLLALFSNSKAHGLESPKAKAYRLVHVKDLFNDDKNSIQHYRNQKSLRHKRR
ncbi:hypothetical protein B566_EDAN004889 [Ephemera danica]|nr:hypothetical protein B566_EDAN004889 [Ephemera danica]